MSDLARECPGCGSNTSTVGIAFRDGEPCPYCGLPAEAARLIDEARERHVSDALVTRAVEADKRARDAEEELARLRRLVGRMRQLLQENDR